jgi:biopolymer transport protein ExbB/TolQ
MDSTFGRVATIIANVLIGAAFALLVAIPAVWLFHWLRRDRK